MEARYKDTGSCAEPLFSLQDVKKALLLFKEIEYNTWVILDDQVELMFTDAGHLIGSAAVHLKVNEQGELKTLTFSG